ncbi:MAG: hypothetical protein JWQ88_618 [Rhodoferax sp.]|nr:hypothetical protein [Rhodoferax sp.]
MRDARLRGLGRLRVDLIGVASVFADDGGGWLAATAASDARNVRDAGDFRDVRDVRLRVAMNHADRQSAERLVREVTALYTCGPAGGGGVRTGLRQRLGTVSCAIDRGLVPASFRFVEAAP